MTKPTQATRVLASLARAGDHGVTQAEWLVPGGADGKGRITRVAARVEELRADGIAIVSDSRDRRDGFVVYRWVREASTQKARERAGEAGGMLFDLPAEKRDSSHWRAA